MLNNKQGFAEKNMRALCDVGRSTKAAVSGYIGEKGIGFKSVFRVTDTPQVHSGGYHVAFDLQAHSSLGYVLPTWVGEGPEELQVAGGWLAGRSGARHYVHVWCCCVWKRS